MTAPVKIQRNIAILAVVLFAIKMAAWYLTQSVAIYTDALESIVNVVAGFLGLYSVWLAAQPRDFNHPYGHGKVEYLSASIEGALIIIAGLLIIIESIKRIFHPQVIQQLDWGLVLILITALVNAGYGIYAKKKGKEHHSVAIIASGKHLLTDTYSTFGIIVGLLLMRITQILWLDVAMALASSILILYTGYKVLRTSLAGIMDEADEALLQKIIAYLQAHKRTEWIDLHNLRTIKYGSILHIDAHMTLPWYLNIEQGHEEINRLEQLIKQRFSNSVEMFIHVDACKPESCKVCKLQNCAVRKFDLEEDIIWTVENVVNNKQHRSHTPTAQQSN